MNVHHLPARQYTLHTTYPISALVAAAQRETLVIENSGPSGLDGFTSSVTFRFRGDDLAAKAAADVLFLLNDPEHLLVTGLGVHARAVPVKV